MPFVIVENPGTDREDRISDFRTYRAAHEHLKSYYTQDEQESGFVQIMKETPQGDLTTEF